MIQKPFAFVFEPFLKSWKVAKIDQNGKGLAFTFFPFSAIFQLLKNGLKRPEITLGVVKNDSKAVCLCFGTVFKKLKKWENMTKMVRG